MFETDLRVNMSLSYASGPATVTVFAQNLFMWGGNFRGYFSASGINNGTGMNGIVTTLEPRVFGVKSEYKF